jgi:thiamine pyrophosphate-dependent enzyme
MIEAAIRPLLLIGAGANRKTTCNMLQSFVEKTGIPFFSTQMGKGVIDERNPLFLGTAALSDDDFLHRAIDPVYYPRQGVIGDIAISIWQLSEQIKHRTIGISLFSNGKTKTGRPPAKRH